MLGSSFFYTEYGQELTSTEDLQNLQRLVIAEVLNEVTHVAGYNPDIACHVVECARIALCGKDGDTSTTLDEERPGGPS